MYTMISTEAGFRKSCFRMSSFRMLILEIFFLLIE